MDSSHTTVFEAAPASAPADPPESRWPAAIAVLAVGGVYTALPPSLSVGPRWLQLAIVVALLIPTVISHQKGKHRLNLVLGHLVAAVTTGFMLWSLILLIRALPTHREPPTTMLRSAAALWMSNLLIFAYWYWRLDAGGPHRRSLRPGHDEGAFLFPQMTQQKKHGPLWSPRFVDYVFLAFNTSTAFSPTDTAVLSRWAKVLTMIQSLISLTVVVTLAARAVNIL